jgi:replicative DNA helicase
MTDDHLFENGLPAAISAEKAVLGSIILDNELMNRVEATLELSDFYLDSHRRILAAMKALHKNGCPIDPVTVHALLQERDELEQAGGATYIGSLIDGVPRTDNIEYYCRIIKYQSSKRQALRLLNNAMTSIVDREEDLDAILQSVASGLAKISESRSDGKAISGVYSTLDDFFDAEIEEPEEILFGVHRGEVAAMVAVTNYGKTTLLYNATLSIAAGQIYNPLAPTASKPRRVLYIDSESPAARAQADLKRMLAGIADPQAARENFAVVVDASISGSPLNLGKPDHIKRIVQLAKAHRADLVVIDTAASAFEPQDENSNAEVTRRVMNPLKQLARETNCAVIFTHHIGKATETQTGEGAYRGRGASAFGALARTAFTLERDPKKGREYIILSCPKIKGEPFEPVLLRLNHETRWFEICDEQPEAKPSMPTAEEIADFVEERGEAGTEDIKKHFALRASARTIQLRIELAKNLGLIEKPTKQAPWRMCKAQNGDFSAVSEVVEESSISENVQMCKPYKELHIAHPHGNGNGKGAAQEGLCATCEASGPRFTDCPNCGDLIR